MIPQPYVTLMHGEIDGTNSPADSRRLAEFLADSPEAAAHFAELRDAVGLVEQTPPLAPPPQLRQRILAATDALPLPGPSRPPRRFAPARGGVRTLFANLREQPGVRYAFAAGFAVCFLLAAAAWRLASSVDRISPEDLRGTILREVAADRGCAADPVTIATSGVAGTVRIFHAGVRTLVLLSLTSDRPVQVRLISDAAIGCESVRATPPTSGGLAATDRQIDLDHDGARDYEIVLTTAEGTDPILTVQIRAEDHVRFERTITRERN